MKTKKIVIGAMAASMLSLSICSLMPAAAADGTVQISVGSASVKAGEKFTVEVSIADIPATGIQACNFSLEYDSSVISIDDVKEGALVTKISDSSDPSSSLLPAFNSYINKNEGTVSLMWTTSVDDASYWLKGEGVFCTISGTAVSGAKDGSVANIKIVPTNRSVTSGSGVQNEEIDCGYLKNGERVSYPVKQTDGKVTIGTGNVSEDLVWGDFNGDEKVTVADAAAILQHLANGDKYPGDDKGKKQGDVDGEKGITVKDASVIQKYVAGVIKKLPL